MAMIFATKSHILIVLNHFSSKSLSPRRTGQSGSIGSTAEDLPIGVAARPFLVLKNLWSDLGDETRDYPVKVTLFQFNS